MGLPVENCSISLGSPDFIGIFEFSFLNCGLILVLEWFGVECKGPSLKINYWGFPLCSKLSNRSVLAIDQSQI